jgi:hypothetical protein
MCIVYFQQVWDFSFFEAGSHYVDLAGLELEILLSQPPKC